MRMLTITALTLSTALAVGAPVYAQDAGLAQLEAEVGVAAGALPANALYRLVLAERDNDEETARFIKQQYGLLAEPTTEGSVVVDPDAGAAQMAATAGVEAGVYSLNELQRLIKAQEDNDMETIDYILSGGDREMTMKKSEVTPGEEQLAVELGVNPKLYTLQELTEMKARKDSADNNG